MGAGDVALGREDDAVEQAEGGVEPELSVEVAGRAEVGLVLDGDDAPMPDRDRLLVGDANGDGSVNSGDFTAVANEFLGVSLGSGQPDCNEDGAVNSGDFTCVANIFLGL